MKFTMTSVFVAALAAVSSAAVAGEAPLPAKFTLKATAPTRGTVLEEYLGQVTVDSYGSRESAKSYIYLLVILCN